MQFTKSTLFALASMLAMAPLSATAHMIMASPVPYGNPNNSPLVDNGSDFPCKAASPSGAKMNAWPVGSTQNLTFTGTAVHGGGSCQISVTTDKAPTKDSKWKVIYSIEGGCPAAVEGNLDPNGPSSAGAFPFTIPSELPNGELTMAWTWFNRIGNREMYMNCAAVSVSGGSDDSTAFDGLPDMAVANIGTNSCKTTEGSDYAFENPGKYVLKAGDPKNQMVPLCGGAPVTGGGGGAGNTAPQQSANPGIPSPAPAPSQAPAASVPIVQSTLRTIITVTAPMAPVPTSPTASASACTRKTNATMSSQPSISAALTPVPLPSANPAPTPQPPTPSAAPGTGVGTSPSSSNGTTCSPNGALVCSPDGTQFAICNWGKAVFMPVAEGTKCAGGQIARRRYAHVKAMRRRHGGVHGRVLG